MTRIRSCVLVILFVLFLLCVFILFSLHTKSLEEQAAFAALAAAALPTEEKNVQESLPDASALTDVYATPYSEPIKQTDDLNFEPPAENAERFSELLSKNADFAGWLSIEGTHVNYPVMWTPEEPDYYLHRDFEKQESICGTPYIGGCCSPESSSIIIFGHNMKDGTMFSGLLSYENESFFHEHPSFSYDTVMHSAEFDVLAVFREKIHYRDEIGAFRYYDYTGDLTQEQFEEYLSRIKAASLYDTGQSCAYGDRLITLSTCAYHTENGRFVVVGVEHKT